MTDYSKMTDEEFDAIAMEIIKDPSSEWTSIPDVDEQWAKRNPDKAWLDKDGVQIKGGELCKK